MSSPTNPEHQRAEVPWDRALTLHGVEWGSQGGWDGGFQCHIPPYYHLQLSGLLATKAEVTVLETGTQTLAAPGGNSTELFGLLFRAARKVTRWLSGQTLGVWLGDTYQTDEGDMVPRR